MRWIYLFSCCLCLQKDVSISFCYGLGLHLLFHALLLYLVFGCMVEQRVNTGASQHEGSQVWLPAQILLGFILVNLMSTGNAHLCRIPLTTPPCQHASFFMPHLWKKSSCCANSSTLILLKYWLTCIVLLNKHMKWKWNGQILLVFLLSLVL